MAVQFVRAHTSGSNVTTGLTVDWTTAAAVPPGNLLVVFAIADNNDGTTPTLASVGKPAGETNSWTIVSSPSSQTGIAAGVVGGLAYIVTTTTWPTATAYTATFSTVANTPPKRVIVAGEFSGATTNIRVAASTFTTTAGSLSSSATMTAGDLLLFGGGYENNANPTQTVGGVAAGGSVAAIATTGGNAITNIAALLGYGIAGSSGTGTWNVSGTGDGTAAALVLQPLYVGNASLSGDGSLSGAGTVVSSGSLSGDGSLTFSSTLAISVSVGLSGSGTLALVGSPIASQTDIERGSGLTATGWTSTANAYDSGTGTFATWSTSTASAISTAYVTGYNFGNISGATNLVSLSLAVKHYETGNMTAPKVQAYRGATALGTQTTLTLNTVSTAVAQTINLTGVTLSDLLDPTFQIQIVAQKGTGGTAATFNLDYAEITAVVSPVLLSGSGTLAASGVVVFNYSGSAALSGSGTVAIDGKPTFSDSISTSGSGTLAVAGTVSQSQSLSGDGTVTLSGTPRIAVTVALSGSGTLAGAGTVLASGSLSGSGTVAGSGKPAFADSISTSGSGALNTAGSISDSIFLSGSGALGVIGAPKLFGSADTSGSGTLAGAGTVLASGSLSGSGTVAGSGKPAFADSISLSGSGALTTSGRVIGAIALSGNGLVSVAGTPKLTGSIGASGSGSLVGVGTVLASQAFSGAGSLNVTGKPLFSDSLSRSGSGSLATAGSPSASSTTGFSGSGTLGATGAIGTRSSLSGSGSLTTGPNSIVITALASIATTGQVGASVVIVNNVSSAIAAVGAINAISEHFVANPAFLTTGSLSPSATAIILRSSNLEAFGYIDTISNRVIFPTFDVVPDVISEIRVIYYDTAPIFGQTNFAASVRLIQQVTPTYTASGQLSATVYSLQELHRMDYVSWTFVEVETDESYTLAINPNAMEGITFDRSYQFGVGRRASGVRGVRQPTSMTFSGVIRSQSYHDNLIDWQKKPGKVVIKDHLNRRFEVMMESVDITERRPSGNDTWRFTYDFKCSLLRRLEDAIPDWVTNV